MRLDGFSNPAGVDVVINSLQGLLGLNAEGQVTIGLGGDFDSSVEIIASFAPFSTEVPDGRRVDIARRAIIDSKKAKSLSAGDVLARILVGQKEYLQQPLTPFVLLSSLSIRYSPELKTVRLADALLTFSSSTSARFKLPSTALRGAVHYGPAPTDYTSVRVRVSARDFMSAGELAIDRLDFVRAIWNLFRNRSRWRISLGNRGRPINDILLGPIHTLHHPDGAPASEIFWWEPSYVEPHSPVDLTQDLSEMRTFERWVRAHLAASSMRLELEGILNRYVRALDERDLNPALVTLWGVLEDLTGTRTGDTHKVTVRRAAFVFKDGEFRKLVLNHLREWRNRIVHEGRGTGEGERMVQELQHHVAVLLGFLLSNAKTFRSFDEVGRFLDLPPDPDILSRRIKHLQKAYRMCES